MQLIQLNDQQLIEKTLNLVREERELLTQVLKCFREIQKRRLFSDYRYSSLFEMAVKHFGYSEDQAYRRIAAMKLLTDLPQLEEKVNSGALSLAHISLANSLFRQEAKSGETEMSREQKMQVFEKISNTSVREAERVTLALSSQPQKIKPDQIKARAQEQVEIRFNASKDLQDQIERLRGLLAHKKPHMTLAELFTDLCELGLFAYSKDTTQSFLAFRKRCVMKTEAEVRRNSQTDRETTFTH